jgi:diguanylate cyclase (GGDEF)-like protein
MKEKILLITENIDDFKIIKREIEKQNFEVSKIIHRDEIEKAILRDIFTIVIADYECSRESLISWIDLVQKNRLRSSFIIYGDKIDRGDLLYILNKGAYGFIPRSILSEMILYTILGALENRKAFLEASGKIDRLINHNQRLHRKSEILKNKNKEVCFLNRISLELICPNNWDLALPKIIQSGLEELIEYDIFGIFCSVMSCWNLSIHIHSGDVKDDFKNSLIKEVVSLFSSLSGEFISPKDVHLKIHYATTNGRSLPLDFLSRSLIIPLSISESLRGILFSYPWVEENQFGGKYHLLSSLSNILSISLKNARDYYKQKELAITDSLTGIYNYRGLYECIKREIKRAKRYKKPLSIVMIDVDNFKRINDSYGHQAGNYVLMELARCMKRSVREIDIVGRYGGDEFMLILPDTERSKSEILLKRILKNIKAHTFQWNNEKINLDISIGISDISEMEGLCDEKKLIERADSEVYLSKQLREIHGEKIGYGTMKN